MAHNHLVLSLTSYKLNMHMDIDNKTTHSQMHTYIHTHTHHVTSIHIKSQGNGNEEQVFEKRLCRTER